MELVIKDIRAQEQAHTKKALQMAAHWESEAQRQAAIAQHGDVVALQKRVEEQEAQMLDVQELLVDTQAQVTYIPCRSSGADFLMKTSEYDSASRLMPKGFEGQKGSLRSCMMLTRF